MEPKLTAWKFPESVPRELLSEHCGVLLLQVLWRNGLWDSWLQGKVDLQYNAQQQVVEVQGGVRLKVLRMQVTDKQDMQLTLGADFSSNSNSQTAESGGGGSLVSPAGCDQLTGRIGG